MRAREAVTAMRLLMIDCCPFSVLVSLIAHEVSGRREDYRNRRLSESGSTNVCGCRARVIFATKVLESCVQCREQVSKGFKKLSWEDLAVIQQQRQNKQKKKLAKIIM